MKNQITLINIAEDFIKKNNLGQTDIFTADEKEINYTDIERERLDYLINICDDFVNEKISVNNLQSIIKDKLQISDSLSKEIYENIISQKNDEIEQAGDEIGESNDTINQNHKKSIFSTIIDEK